MRGSNPSFIEEWNVMFPKDFWWRRKYNIPFGSKLHREQNLLDIAIEYEEEQIYNRLKEEALSKEKGEGKYIPGRGYIFKENINPSAVTDNDVEDFFNIPIDELDLDEDGTLKI